MKQSLLSLAGLGLLVVAIAPCPVHAGTFDFTLDEQGNGTQGGIVMPGVLAPDPSNGGALALTYFVNNFGVFAGQGDILINEPTGGLSDVLRFTNATGGLNDPSALDDRIIFYSDATAGDSTLADTGFPANVGTGHVFGTVNESGPEGNNTFFFQGSGASYSGISDAPAVTPEPSTLSLLGISIAGIAGYTWRRRKRAAA